MRSHVVRAYIPETLYGDYARRAIQLDQRRATMPDTLTSCPRCCSTEGYEWVRTVRVEGKWGGPGHDAEDGVDPKTVRCRNCGNRADIERATGGKVR